MLDTPSKLKRNTLIGTGVFILLGFIYYVIFMRRTFQRFDYRIPYVWEKDFNRTFIHYLKTAPSRNVLLLAAPYQSGKSRAMDVMTDDLTYNGHLVINIDPTSATSTRELIKIIKMAVIKGMTTVRTQLSSSTKAHVGELFPQPYFKKQFSAFDSSMAKAGNALFAILDNSTTNSQYISQFLDLLETLNPYLRPVIFIHNLQHIQKISPEIYDAAKARLSRRSDYLDFVPVVCEIRDSSFRMNQSYTLSSSFRIIDLPSLHDPSHRLVVTNKVLSSLELRKILDNFGGHGGIIERVYEDLRSGVEIEDAINKQMQLTKSFIRNTLGYKIPGIAHHICAHDGFAPFDIQNISLAEPLLPLIHTGHLFITENLTIRAAHKGVLKAMCK